MENNLHFQVDREKTIFTFTIQQINTEKIDTFTTLGKSSVPELVILCLMKNVALKLCHYCFMWKQYRIFWYI